MITMMVLAIFIMTLPILLYTSLNHPKFHTQIGIGDYDILLDIQQGQESPENIAKANQTLNQMAELTFIEKIPYKKLPLAGDLEGFLLCQIKEHSQADTYWKGKAPNKVNEIALSYLASQDLDRQIGEIIHLTYDGKIHDFTITGIYSDITNGGKSARILDKPTDIPLMKQTYGLQLKNRQGIGPIIQDLQGLLPFAEITPTQEMAALMFAPIRKSLSFVLTAAIVVAIGLISLVLYLFLHLNFVENRYQTAVLTCLGFSDKDIKGQYYFKVGFILILSLLIGYGLISSLGQILIQVFLQSMGGTGFTFLSPFCLQYLLLPLSLLAFTYFITTYILSKREPVITSQVIKEA